MSQEARQSFALRCLGAVDGWHPQRRTPPALRPRTTARPSFCATIVLSTWLSRWRSSCVQGLVHEPVCELVVLAANSGERDLAELVRELLSIDPEERSEEHTSELQSLRHLVC